MSKLFLAFGVIVSLLLLALPLTYNANAVAITPQQRDCLQKIVEGMLIFGAGSSSSAVDDNVNAIEKCLQ